jgi:hypothetical protein
LQLNRLNQNLTKFFYLLKLKQNLEFNKLFKINFNGVNMLSQIVNNLNYYEPIYYDQAKSLELQNSFQAMTLCFADVSVATKKSGRFLTLMGAVVSASCHFFNFDSSVALTYTVIGGSIWVISELSALKFESEAKEILEVLKGQSKERMDQGEAKRFGLL